MDVIDLNTSPKTWAANVALPTSASTAWPSRISTDLNSESPVSPASVAVSLSPEGQAKIEKEKQRNSDIDATTLPDNIKDSLKAIREIQQKVSEKAEELGKLATDKTLTGDSRETRSKQLQIEIHSLQGALSDAQSALNNAMSAQRLSVKDRNIAKSLIGST